MSRSPAASALLVAPRIALGLLALTALACQRAEPETVRVPAPPAPYDFGAPVAAYTLPPELQEISGLAVLDAHHLGAIQDEDGDLFVIDIDSARITHVHDFGKKGDYEGVERLGDAVYVLRSDGRLYGITDWSADRADADGFDTGLHGSCDAEGLGQEGARLLIACKESPGRGRKGSRSVFAYDPATRTLDPSPAFAVYADSLGANGATRVDHEVRKLVRPVADINSFKPAALAVHPVSRHLYLVSSVRKEIVVLRSDGTLAAVWPLPESLFRQPEGLAFLDDGTLFISNEAAGADPTLLRFTYTPAR